MAEGGEFELSVGVTADVTAFNEQVATAFRQASAGVIVPVRAAQGSGVASAGAGGQGAPVGTSYSAAEAAAVNRALEGARAPSSYASGGGPGGSSYRDAMGGGGSIRFNTGEAEIGVRRVRGIFEEMKRFAETPIVIRFDTAAAEATLARVRAEMRSMGGPGGVGAGWGGEARGASGAAGAAIARGASPRAAVAAAIAASGGDLVPTRIASVSIPGSGAQAAAVAEAEANALGAGGAPAAGRNPLLMRFPLRGLLAYMALREVKEGIVGVRDAESEMRTARTPEDRELIRQQGKNAFYSTTLGSLISVWGELADAKGSPSRAIREAKEGVENRREQDEIRDSKLAVQASRAERLAGLGSFSAQRERIESEYTARAAKRAQQAIDLPEHLSVMSIVEEGREDRATTDAKLNQIEEDRVQSVNQRFGEIKINRAIAGGGSERAISRLKIKQDFEDRLLEDRRAHGFVFGSIINAAGAGAALAGFDQKNTRADTAEITGLQSSAEQSRLRAVNNPFRSRLVGLRDQTEAAMVAARAAGKPQSVLDSILAEGQGSIRATVAEQARSDRLQSIQLRGAGLQLGALINGDPLGAQLAGIRAQRDTALAQSESDDAKFKPLHQKLIRDTSALSEIYARQGQVERRFDLGQSLESEIRQSKFRQEGGDTNRIKSVLDRIESETAGDVRGLLRQKDFGNADKRRQLGIEQVHEQRADFYRSIRFEEVSGDRIVAGRGNPFGGADKAFKDAEKDIANRKDEKDPAVAGDDSVPRLLKSIDETQKSIDDTLKRMEKKKDVARAS